MSLGKEWWQEKLRSQNVNISFRLFLKKKVEGEEHHRAHGMSRNRRSSEHFRRVRRRIYCGFFLSIHREIVLTYSRCETPTIVAFLAGKWPKLFIWRRSHLRTDHTIVKIQRRKHSSFLLWRSPRWSHCKVTQNTHSHTHNGFVHLRETERGRDPGFCRRKEFWGKFPGPQELQRAGKVNPKDNVCCQLCKKRNQTI